MSILNYFKAVSISVKMQKLYKRINEKAAIMDTENGESKIEKISVKEFTKWYSSKLKMVLCQDLVQVKMRNFSPF